MAEAEEAASPYRMAGGRAKALWGVAATTSDTCSNKKGDVNTTNTVLSSFLGMAAVSDKTSVVTGGLTVTGGFNQQLEEQKKIKGQFETIFSRLHRVSPEAPSYLVFTSPTGASAEQTLNDWGICAQTMLHEPDSQEELAATLKHLGDLATVQVSDPHLRPQPLTDMVKLLTDVSTKEFLADEHTLFGGRASLMELSCALRENCPRVLHVGTAEDKLTVADETGAPCVCDMKEFVSAVAPAHVGWCTEEELAHRPMLVVLAFADSKRTAETLVMRGVPCVIAWEGNVSPPVINFFIRCFYRALNLRNNASIATAFHEARGSTFHRKRKCKLGREREGGDGSPVIVTVAMSGCLCSISERNPDGFTDIRVVPAGECKVHQCMESILGVLPFHELSPRTRGPRKDPTFVANALMQWAINAS